MLNCSPKLHSTTNPLRMSDRMKFVAELMRQQST